MRIFPATSPIHCPATSGSRGFHRNSIPAVPTGTHHNGQRHQPYHNPLAIDGRPSSTPVPDIEASFPAMIRFLSCHQHPAQSESHRADHAVICMPPDARNRLKRPMEFCFQNSIQNHTGEQHARRSLRTRCASHFTKCVAYIHIRRTTDITKPWLIYIRRASSMYMLFCSCFLTDALYTVQQTQTLTHKAVGQTDTHTWNSFTTNLVKCHVQVPKWIIFVCVIEKHRYYSTDFMIAYEQNKTMF